MLQAIINFFRSKSPQITKHILAYNPKESRKYRITLLVLLAATLLCGAPPMISSWVFKQAPALTVVSGSEFVTIISLLIASYFTANVVQKKGDSEVSLNAKKEAKKEEKEEVKKEEAV